MHNYGLNPFCILKKRWRSKPNSSNNLGRFKMIDEDILKQVAKVEKERVASGGKPMGDLDKLTLATKLQKEKISTEACTGIAKQLQELTTKVNDLSGNGIGVSSLRSEYLKLGTALGISRTKTRSEQKPLAQPKVPSVQEREAAILLAFKTAGVKKLKSGHFSKTLIHNAAVQILKDAGAVIIVDGKERGFTLSPTQVQGAFKNLCQASVDMTAEDIQIVATVLGQNPRGKPVKIALKKTVADDKAAVTAAKKRIADFKQRIESLAS